MLKSGLSVESLTKYFPVSDSIFLQIDTLLASLPDLPIETTSELPSTADGDVTAAAAHNIEAPNGDAANTPTETPRDSRLQQAPFGTVWKAAMLLTDSTFKIRLPMSFLLSIPIAKRIADNWNRQKTLKAVVSLQQANYSKAKASAPKTAKTWKKNTPSQKR